MHRLLTTFAGPSVRVDVGRDAFVIVRRRDSDTGLRSVGLCDDGSGSKMVRLGV